MTKESIIKLDNIEIQAAVLQYAISLDINRGLGSSNLTFSNKQTVSAKIVATMDLDEIEIKKAIKAYLSKKGVNAHHITSVELNPSGTTGNIYLTATVKEEN